MLRLLYKFYNIIFLLVLFGVFRNTPLYLLDKILSLVGVFICIFWISYDYLVKKNAFYKFSKIFLVIFFTIGCFSVFASRQLYGQALGDCLGANIDFSQLLFIVFYAYAFKTKKLKVKDLASVFKWFILLDVIVIYAFKDYAPTAVSTFSNHDIIFKAQILPKEFVRFGVMYFFVLFLKREKYIYALISGFLLLYPNLLLVFERGYFATTVMLMLITVLTIRKSKRLFRNLTLIVYSIFMFIVIVVTAAGPVADTIISRYGEVLNGITTGTSNDVSVSYRFKEGTAALKLFAQDPILGSGKLKSATTETVLGMDYYPSDIGVLGILSTYGIVGLIIYIVMLIMSIRIYWRTIKNSRQHSYMTICLSIYVLSLAITSLQTASIILSPAEWCFLFIFYIYSRNIDIERNLMISEQVYLASLNEQQIAIQ